MIPVILLAIGLILVAVPAWRSPTSVAAFVLALIALLMSVTHWSHW